MNGKDSNVINNLITNMNDASKELNFEKAASIRDKIRSLEKTNQNFKNIFKNIEEADFFSITNIKNEIAIEVTFCRNGQNFGSNTHYIESKIEDDLKVILQKFLVQFYSTQHIPKKIIVSEEIYERKLLEDAFFLKLIQKQKYYWLKMKI